MADTHYKILFYVSLSYSYPVLRPVEAELLRRGHEVRWFVQRGSEAEKFIRSSDKTLQTVVDVKRFEADATLVPGNSVPSFFPGIKVQVFHGFDSGKKNKFKIRGYFDLYCTQGPMTTRGFEAQRSKIRKPSFDVVETGWPKLDPLFTPQPETAAFTTDVPQILYAPTFSPKLTSSYGLLDEINHLSRKKNWQWLVKFHPKATEKEVDMYRVIENTNLRIVETEDVIPLLQSADVLLSDTSSILSEFSLQDKVVVSFNNRRPASWMIGFTRAEALEESLLKALNPDPALSGKITAHRLDVHPYQDGLSSQRVVDAVETMLEKGTDHLKRKPLNLFRNLKERKRLGYYGL
ncbi:MAG TPA: CDP-glycerol:glycerophosphate glycerophosphotransferase [Gammaproteobacteria bacterium]|nr:CDP-glycerol:glycerophosphate glycerophosphotransferase [Gammaproteobacteria bacterium]